MIQANWTQSEFSPLLIGKKVLSLYQSHLTIIKLLHYICLFLGWVGNEHLKLSMHQDPLSALLIKWKEKAKQIYFGADDAVRVARRWQSIPSICRQDITLDLYRVYALVFSSPKESLNSEFSFLTSCQARTGGRWVSVNKMDETFRSTIIKHNWEDHSYVGSQCDNEITLLDRGLQSSGLKVLLMESMTMYLWPI